MLKYLSAIFAATLIPACASIRSVDSTRAVEAIALTESGNAGQFVVPGYLTGNPELAEKLIVIAPGNGRNSSGEFFYPDGTKAASWNASRSEVTEALLAGIAGIDAEKFMQDAIQRQFMVDMLDKVMSFAQQYMPQPQPQPQEPPSSWKFEALSILALPEAERQGAFQAFINRHINEGE